MIGFYFMSLDKRRGKGQGISKSPYQNKAYPDHLKKEGCIYLDGEITFSSRGFYKVAMENGMESICTANRMDHKRVGILPGDQCTVEIPAASLSPGAAVKGRIVWRIRASKQTD